MSPRILLTGASGGLGSRVLYHLLHTLSLSPSSILISTPRAQPQSPDENGVELRHGDFLEPKTLTSAFANAAVLFLVSHPSIAHSLRVEAHINAINAAIRAGIKHIVYTSLAFAGDSEAEVMRAHIDTEDYLRHTCAGSGCRYTIVREGIYSESYPLYLGFFDVRAQAEAPKRQILMPATEGQKVAWVTRDELGEGNAKILLDVLNNLANPDGGAYADKTITLTGSVAYSLNEVGAAVGQILGWSGSHKLEIREVSENEFVHHHAANRGGSEDAEGFVRAWASTYPAISKGELAVIDPTLEKILGRRPRDFQDVLPELLQDIGDADRNTKQYAK